MPVLKVQLGLLVFNPTRTRTWRRNNDYEMTMIIKIIYNTPLHTKHQSTVKSNLTFHLCERIIQHWPFWPVHPFPYTPCQWRMAGSTWRYVPNARAWPDGGPEETLQLKLQSTSTFHQANSHLRQTLSNFKLGTSSALQCRFRCLSSCAWFGNKVWGK